jgi:hypothetical protein
MPEQPLAPDKVQALSDELQSGSLKPFALTLNLLRPAEHGFSARDVAHVEAQWAYLGRDHFTGGYVLRLRASRRLYLEFLVGSEPLPERSRSISVRSLAPDEVLPQLDRPKETVMWNNEVEKLNEFIERIWR